MKRDLFDVEHEAFRKSIRAFLGAEAVPYREAWDNAGIVDRAVFAALGANGFIGTAIGEEYGGGGTSDFRFNAVLDEELMAADLASLAAGLSVHNDICVGYLVDVCTAEQKARWLPGVGRRGHDRGDRHERAGHGFRPGGDVNHSDPRR